MRILKQKTYRPGDMPPEGYLAWHEWAEVQRKAGIKQVQCGECGLWKTPQELSGVRKEFVAKNIKNGVVSVAYDICTKCNNN